MTSRATLNNCKPSSEASASWLATLDHLLQTLLQTFDIDSAVLPERPGLAQLKGKRLGAQAIVGIGTEHNGGLVLQQHRFHPGRTQARQLFARVATALLEGIQRKLLDLRPSNGRASRSADEYAREG